VKIVFLFRHAKSDWDVPFGSDADRPLAPRGREAAARIGRFLTRIREAPDLVVSSPAVRAWETARIAGEAGSWGSETVLEDALYSAGEASILRLVRDLDDGVGRVALVGHEPTTSSLAAELTGGGQIRFPTAAIARIRFPAERWRDLRPRSGTLSWHVTPKILQRLEND